MKNINRLFLAFLVSSFALCGCGTKKDEKKTFTATFTINGETIGDVQKFDKDNMKVVEPVCSDPAYIYDWEKYTLTEADIVIKGYKKLLKTEIDISDEKMVHYTGRVDDVEGEKVFYNANSGFEFEIYGTKVSATLSTNKSNTKMRVYVDDDLEGSIITVDGNKTAYTLASDLKKDKHIIKVVKANTEQWGHITLTKIDEAENFVDLSPINRKKFEFYGDSLISGYGVNCLQGDTYENEDPTKAYAKLIGEHYDADISCLAYSGVSIAIPNWITWLASEKYEGYCYLADDNPWDFSSWTPDVVFICLGANDSGKISSSNMNTFITKVTIMLTELKEYYPNSKIVCYYGVTGTNSLIDSCYQMVVEGFEPSAGIYYCNAKKSTTSGYNGHLNKQEQINVAADVINFIEENKIV